jgi:HEAT repeat protein
MTDQVDLLIDILFDNTAREDERDDAAMDLGRYDDDKALNALLLIASNLNENDTVLDSSGESIAKILTRRKELNKDIFENLHPIAKRAAYSFIKEVKPEWI